MRKLLFYCCVYSFCTRHVPTLVVPALVSAANLKLYLKDGGFQLVREYKVEGDRIKYYSVERSDWEEIPVDLVDLKRTNAETAARQETLNKGRRRHLARRRASGGPRRPSGDSRRFRAIPGVYRLEDDKLRIFNCRRSQCP